MTDEFFTTKTSKVVQVGDISHRITVNDRAATRATIFRRITAAGFPAIERSDWAARDMKATFEEDWDYSMIAIHHAGRSYICNPGALQMQEIQSEHKAAGFGDVGYHYGIDCSGFIFEGRDIRYKGSHLVEFNTGVVGIVLLQNLTSVSEGDDDVADVRVMAKENIGYDTTPEIPARQIDALLALIKVLKSVFNIFILGGHREFPFQDGKICPGDLALELVRLLRSQSNLLAPSKV